MTIDSLACSFNFKFCNNNCIEPVNFAYLQTDGVPAGPPSRLRFSVEVPRGGHLTFTTAIATDYQSRPAVEFVVKVVRKGREDVVFSRLLDRQVIELK